MFPIPLRQLSWMHKMHQQDQHLPLSPGHSQGQAEQLGEQLHGFLSFTEEAWRELTWD